MLSVSSINSIPENISTWEERFSETIGTGAPSYMLVLVLPCGKYTMRIARSELSFRWYGSIGSSSNRMLTRSYNTPDEAVARLKTKLSSDISAICPDRTKQCSQCRHLLQ